jgi:hyperosmotically inducible periplasmic protein
MRSYFRLSLIPAAIVAVSLAACVATRTQESTGEYLDDAGITTRVKANLIGDELVKARQVEVETFRGVVQLNGFVDSTAARDRATIVTRSVSGVADVHNNLVVQASDRSVGTVVDDATITAKVKTALIGNPDTKATQINVSTREGVVQLSGFVNDSKESYMAEHLAGDVAGVHHVDNQLEVKRLNQ